MLSSGQLLPRRDFGGDGSATRAASILVGWSEEDVGDHVPSAFCEYGDDTTAVG